MLIERIPDFTFSSYHTRISAHNISQRRRLKNIVTRSYSTSAPGGPVRGTPLAGPTMASKSTLVMPGCSRISYAGAVASPDEWRRCIPVRATIFTCRWLVLAAKRGLRVSRLWDGGRWIVMVCCDTSDEGGMSRQKSGCNDKEACVAIRTLRIRAVLESRTNVSRNPQSVPVDKERRTLTRSP